MSQPANDDFSQHLSDDKASYHEDASENGTATNKPKQQQQLILTTTTISNIKLPILKKEEKDGVVRILPPVSAAEIHVVEKERKARTILLIAIPKDHLRRFHGMDDAKEIWEAIRTRFGGNANSKKIQKAVLKNSLKHLLYQVQKAWSNLAMTMRTKPDVNTLSIDDLHNNLRVFEQELTSTSKSSASAQNGKCPSKGTNDGKKRDSFYQDQGAGKKEQNQNCLLTMDDGVVNWGEHTVEEEETNHALMAISSNNEEAQVVTFQSRLSLNINFTFQAMKYMQKMKKLKKYRVNRNEAVKKRNNCRNNKEDFLNKPLYSIFSKNDNFKGVPHPLTGDYTPKTQEHSSCQSNDSEGSFRNPSEHSSESESESLSVPKEMSTSKSVTTNEKRQLKLTEEFRMKREASSFISQIRRDLPRDTSLVRVEVLKYDIKRSKVRSGIMLFMTSVITGKNQQDDNEDVMD
ncbi:hypothetical protein Tco_1393711 [Tanacetum coccineum]